jgi:cell wall hydrolase
VIAKSACAAAIVAVFGVSGVFAEDNLSNPIGSVLTAPPHNLAGAQSNEVVPAPLEIPSVTNSIPPSAAGNVPAAAPQITIVPPPAPVLEAPRPVVEIPPPPPPPTPSDLLGLSGKEHAKERAKAEKCLANAVYFESRGELMRGQVAVAQVVLNRVFSPYYPKDVCGVVYQNAHMHLACQFTFACDGRSKAITERGAWSRAMRVAKQALDGKVWIAAVAKSTHYHAYWVNPSWVAEMKKMYRYGVHTFYRPHRWGDGAQEAGWVVPEMAMAKPAEGKSQPTPAKPVTSNETPAPVVTQAKAIVADSKAKTASVHVLPKLSVYDSKSKTTASTAQAKASATDSKTKPASVNAKDKSSAADSKAKAQSKASANDNKAKPLPSNAQAKAAQKISAQ